tara:strand:- start:74207 stop:74614 length:408 start_codon:yes stop_codon:yes gene_type:complete
MEVENSKENHSEIVEQPKLWNPSAAVNWSLLLTPTFGTCIHYLNWKALGDEKNIKYSLVWFIISIILLLLLTFTQADSGIGFLILIYLFVWYFVAGRKQSKLIKSDLGKDYIKKSWGKPLLISFVAFVAFVYFAV